MVAFRRVSAVSAKDFHQGLMPVERDRPHPHVTIGAKPMVRVWRLPKLPLRMLLCGTNVKQPPLRQALIVVVLCTSVV